MPSAPVSNPKCAACRVRPGEHRKFIKSRYGLQTSWRCAVCWQGKNPSGFKEVRK